MKAFILTLTVLFGSLYAGAQSHNISDYAPVFTYEGITHYVDKTSERKLANGHRVFWSVFDMDGLLFVSVEVNCVTRKSRIRGFVAPSQNGVVTNTDVSPWFPHSDPISSRYVAFGCS